MKAISLRPEWAMPVLLGYKTVECRTWKTDYRGPLLVCAGSKPWPGSISGHALCVVDLDGVEPFTADHLECACMEPDEMPGKKAFAWSLSSVRWIEPFAVKGKLNLFEVDDAAVRPLAAQGRDELRRFYEPLMTWGNRSIPEREVREWWADVLGSF